MAPTKIVLLACGSFNPPTIMHLRMFEVARDNLTHLGQYSVLGGIISPVHDSYGKKDLAPSSYRCEMLKLALQSSDWIRMSNWECSQETWSATRQVLQYHQNLINSALYNESSDAQNVSDNNANTDEYNSDTWITNDIRNTHGPVRIKLLCGADFLESFGVPGLWTEDDVEAIVRHHGLVVVSRHGYNPYQFIYESDLLTRFQNNIVVINEWVTNDISSTKIRRALRRQESVKYLVEDSVISFIKRHGLYGCLKNELKYSYKSNINESLNIPCLSDYILTPSPSDVNMKSVNSGENIYLELRTISGMKQSQSYPQKISEIPDTGVGVEQKKKFEDRIGDETPMRSRKVGFTDGTGASTTMAQNLKQMSYSDKTDSNSDEYRSPEYSNVSDKSSVSGRKIMSERGSDKIFDAKALTKMESEGDKYHKKSIIMLRRSKSDAVMSGRDGNGEETSVKIQFTKDGIKVASATAIRKKRATAVKKVGKITTPEGRLTEYRSSRRQ